MAARDQPAAPGPAPFIARRAIYLVSRTTLATSDDKHVSLSCPTGTKLHSSGAGLSTGASSGEVYLDKIGLYGRGVYTADIDAHEDQTGYTGTWQLFAVTVPSDAESEVPLAAQLELTGHYVAFIRAGPRSRPADAVPGARLVRAEG